MPNRESQKRHSSGAKVQTTCRCLKSDRSNPKTRWWVALSSGASKSLMRALGGFRGPSNMAAEVYPMNSKRLTAKLKRNTKLPTNRFFKSVWAWWRRQHARIRRRDAHFVRRQRAGCIGLLEPQAVPRPERMADKRDHPVLLHRIFLPRLRTGRRAFSAGCECRRCRSC